MPQAASIEVPTVPSEFLAEEELNLTFQVVLIGSDGLIVGSDRRQVYSSPGTPDEHGALQPDEISKFVHSKNGRVICAFAGGPFSFAAADAIASLPDLLESADDLEWRNAVKEACYRIERPAQSRDEITIVRANDLERVLLLNRFNRHDDTITQISRHVSTGNNALPARFLLDHFWEKRPIAQLEKLALLTLVSAAKESKGGIGEGFDLMFLDSSGPKWKRYSDDAPEILAAWGMLKQNARSAIYP